MPDTFIGKQTLAEGRVMVWEKKIFAIEKVNSFDETIALTSDKS